MLVTILDENAAEDRDITSQLLRRRQGNAHKAGNRIRHWRHSLLQTLQDRTHRCAHKEAFCVPSAEKIRVLMEENKLSFEEDGEVVKGLMRVHYSHAGARRQRSIRSGP